MASLFVFPEELMIQSKWTTEKGFTLIELIVVIVLAGILTYVAATKMTGSVADIGEGVAIRKVAADARYAQQIAITDGATVRFVVDVANNRYSLKWLDDSYLKKPVGKQDYIVQFGTGDYAGLNIISCEFVNDVLEFNRKGEPLNGGSIYNGTLVLLNLNNATSVEVAGTGYVETNISD
jgi:prepilin-type N-terminal cleavage/methylation domain-containing protein